MKYKKYNLLLLILIIISLLFSSFSTASSDNIEPSCPKSGDHSDASCMASVEGKSEKNDDSTKDLKKTANDDAGLEIEDVPKEQNTSESQKKTSIKKTQETNNAQFNSQRKKKYVKEVEEEKINYPDELQYQQLFQKPGERRKYITSFTFKSNYTEFYDFNIDDEELDSIKKARITIYPPKRFRLNFQGNFLHFYKIAYEKGMPVYFTVDSMIYAVNENVNRLNKILYEDVLFYYLRSLLKNVINYANDLMDSAEGEPHRYMISHTQLFYAIALELLSENIEKNTYQPVIQGQVNNFMTKIRKYELGEFYIFYSKKQINCSYLVPDGFFNQSIKLRNFYQSIKWFVINRFIFDKKDINPLWYIGKLIVDSGNLELYNKIYESLSFLMGQDSLTPSIVEIYNIGLGLGYNNVFDLSEEQQDGLLKKIIEKKKDIDLPFLNDNFMFSKEMLNAFKMEREYSTSLFMYQFDVEEWVKNKLIIYDQRALRVMMSSYEVTAAIHHASFFKELIFNRYICFNLY